ncbi:hypothetical protein M422DRAFT_239349 [Sphaerobolus stellatus SS14]|nr:hypothetical protein M422DRAFT_239349 [Sphaerobolus stellatus SS14]
MSVGAQPPSYNLTTLAEILGLLHNNNSNSIQSEGSTEEAVQGMGNGTRKDGEYNSITRSVSPTQGLTAMIPPRITSRDADNMPPVVDGMRSKVIYKIPVENSLNKSTYIPPPAGAVEVEMKSPVIDGGILQNTLHSSYTDIVCIHAAQTGHKHVQGTHNISTSDNRLNGQGNANTAEKTHEAEKRYMDNNGYITVKGKNIHRKSRRNTQIKTSGSHYFDMVFESSENDSVNSHDEEENIRTSLPSMSIPTMQGTRPVDMNYRKFTEGILSELPIEEQTRILQ